MLNKNTIDSFEDLYKRGYDKTYLNIELVRLELLFLEKNKNKTLDFGTVAAKWRNEKLWTKKEMIG